MHRRTLCSWIVVALAMLAGLPARAETITPASERRLGAFRAGELAQGVYLLSPADGGAQRANSLVVDREDGLLVVDAQPTPEAARELLGAIAQLSAKPVRYLVLTHPHADSAGGASAFPPTVLLIATEGFRDALADKSYDFGAEARLRLPPESEWKEPARVAPTLVLNAPVALDDPRNAVDLLPIPTERAHSRGDLLVEIRDKKILAVGALVCPERSFFAGDANIGDWLSALNNIAGMAPKAVVPVRGPAVDAREVRLERDAFAWSRGKVRDLFVEGVAPGTMPDRILALPDLKQFFGSPASPSLLRPFFERVVSEAEEWRRKHRIE